jgi:hypothetical protein
MFRRLLFGAVLVTAAATPALAGVVNPDISVIGQPLMRWTDDPFDPSRKRLTFDVGETEFVFDAALNPYARGTFVAALSDEGFELEEGYIQFVRGLPPGLAIKGGKYRLGFGKFNPVHPHAMPFAERPRILAAYLPGDEAFNETGVQVSERLAIGDMALTFSADVLQGDSFRVPRESSGASNDPIDVDALGDREDEPRPAGLGRVSLFVPVGDRSGIELGASGTQGTNNAAAATRTTVLGGDVRAKLWTNARSYVVLHGEVLSLNREDAGWDEVAAAYTSAETKPMGGFVFADWNFNTRYNVGAGFESWENPGLEDVTDTVFRVFGGFSLMEETTAFRLDFEHWQPGAPSGSPDPDAVNTITLRVLYSMGPHKAHQF